MVGLDISVKQGIVVLIGQVDFVGHVGKLSRRFAEESDSSLFGGDDWGQVVWESTFHW